MFRVKVCGVTSVGDALQVAAAGADAVGLNFFSKSARCVSDVIAESIVEMLPESVCRVGVFVNHSADQICQLADRLRLDIIQLHGDERPEVGAELAGRSVLRALRCRSDDWERGAEWVESFLKAGGNLAGLLIDAYHPDEYGGTGRRADSLVFQAFRGRFPQTPLILAGGLTPANVAEVIVEVRPDGVDTASGVEARPGVKDPEKVVTFVLEAENALRVVGK